MIEIKKSIEQGFGPGGLYDILKQLQNGMAGIGGRVYFVENNAGNDSEDLEDGQSWDRAYKTLAFAIGKSNAEISASRYGYGRGWAARNTIFCKGDKIQEDLTTAPSKCDVIGVGSNDAEGKTHIEGKHVFTQSGTNMSMGWYNLTFSNDAAEAIFAVADCGGLYFGDCDFVARSDSIHAIHITGTTGHDLKVNNCRIINDEYADPFDTAGILIATTTTFWNFEIKDSYVEGDIGIEISATNMYNAWIDNNTIKAVTLAIKDDSNDVIITKNMLISAAAATTLTDIVTGSVTKAAQNMVTGGSAGTKNYPPEAA